MSVKDRKVDWSIAANRKQLPLKSRTKQVEHVFVGVSRLKVRSFAMSHEARGTLNYVFNIIFCFSSFPQRESEYSEHLSLVLLP